MRCVPGWQIWGGRRTAQYNRTLRRLPRGQAPTQRSSTSLYRVSARVQPAQRSTDNLSGMPFWAVDTRSRRNVVCPLPLWDVPTECWCEVVQPSHQVRPRLICAVGTQYDTRPSVRKLPCRQIQCSHQRRQVSQLCRKPVSARRGRAGVSLTHKMCPWRISSAAAKCNERPYLWQLSFGEV